MKMSGNLIAAIKLVPEREVDDMWERLIVEKALQIEGAQSAEELLKIQAAVKQLRETQNWFKSERAK